MKTFFAFFLGFLFTFQLFAADIVKNGEALAEIIIPEKPLPVEKYAAQELAVHLEKISGAKLPICSSPSGKPVEIRLGRAAKMPRIAFHANEGIIRIFGNQINIAGNDGDGSPLSFSTSAGTLFAVYDLLEKEFGVRWLWPGELGTLILKKDSLSVADGVRPVKTLINSSTWRIQRGVKNWSSEKVARNFINERIIWLRRHRFTSVENLSYGHAFTWYKKLYGKNHPEYFNLLPDNTRRSDPNYFSGNDHLVSMCVTNPGLVRQIVDNWKKNPDSIINLNENDTPGKCVCPDCLAADQSNDPNRLERAAKKYFANDKNWFRELGSLSERYAKFYLAVQKEADKINPDNKIIGCIYANYFEFPEKTALNDRIIMRFCPPIMYPWTSEKIALFKRLWKGWRKSGVQLMHRPNYTLDGHNFPLMYYNEFAECFDFAIDNGLYASDMDSLTSVFGVNGITLYVIAAKHSQGRNKTVKELEDDYFAAFGNAGSAMQKFVKVMTGATQKYRDGGSDAIEGGVYTNFYTYAGKIFTPQVMKAGFDAIDEAEKLAGNDELILKRIDFVRKGLTDCDLILKVQAGFEKYQKTGEADIFVKYLKQLNGFRSQNEHLCYADQNTLISLESRNWPRHLIMLGDNSFELKNWEIRFDPEQKGIDEKWFSAADDKSAWQSISTDSPWEKQAIGLEWEKKHGKHFKGFGWYRCNFELKNVNPDQQMKLTFGAIDGAAEIWLNGNKIHSREFPYKGDLNSWRLPFDVDITGKLVPGSNFLVVRVEKHLGVSGIWRPVFISCGSVEAPSLNAKFKSNVQIGKINFHTGKFPLEITAVSRGEKRAYGGVWGRLVRSEKVTPKVMYEFKVTFSTDNPQVTFEPWLRSSADPGLNKGNINLKATALPGQKKTLTARILPDTGQCTIFLNITQAPGKITIHDVKLYPLSVINK